MDPIDAYIPPVLQARQQLQKAGEVMGAAAATAPPPPPPAPQRRLPAPSRHVHDGVQPSLILKQSAPMLHVKERHIAARCPEEGDAARLLPCHVAPGKVQVCGQCAGKDPAAARTLLREGAFEGLRDNVKALGEYAVANGTAKDASTLAGTFFLALEAYDYRWIDPCLTHPTPTPCPSG